jgi:opacity protein-like surface antigen
MIVKKEEKSGRMIQREKTCFFTVTFLAFVIVVLSAAMAWSGGIKLRVSAEQANIREKPDIMSAILQQLPEGATLEAERKEGEWYSVQLQKEEGGFVLGYVHESLVMVIEAAPQAPLQRERVQEEKPEAVRPVEKKREEPPLTPAPTPTAPTEMEKRERIHAILWLGGRHAAVGDLNEGAEGLARYYESRLSAVMDGEVEELHFGFLFGAEVRVALASDFYFSLGLEHSSGKTSSAVSYKGGSSEASYSTEPRLRTTPISLALVIYPVRFVYVKAGLDYTLARCDYFYRYSYPDQIAQTESWQEWKGKASSSGFGYQIGLGLDWPLGSRISLIAEAAYRYSRLKSFEGEDIYQESTGYQTAEEGTLYHIRVSAGGKKTYPTVFIRNREPTEAGVMEVRRAELDLSGYGVRLGIRVSF